MAIGGIAAPTGANPFIATAAAASVKGTVSGTATVVNAPSVPKGSGKYDTTSKSRIQVTLQLPDGQEPGSIFNVYLPKGVTVDDAGDVYAAGKAKTAQNMVAQFKGAQSIFSDKVINGKGDLAERPFIQYTLTDYVKKNPKNVSLNLVYDLNHIDAGQKTLDVVVLTGGGMKTISTGKAYTFVNEAPTAGEIALLPAATQDPNDPFELRPAPVAPISNTARTVTWESNITSNAATYKNTLPGLSLIHISEPTRPY